MVGNEGSENALLTERSKLETECSIGILIKPQVGGEGRGERRGR